jgi:hypothetical protein
MSVHLHSASDAHADALSLEERRRSGTVYTPSPLASFILDRAGCTGEALLRGGALLDPACGGGVFLVEALRRVARVLGNGAPLSGAERQQLLTYARQKLFGIDIDRMARQLTIEALRETTQQLAPGPLPTRFVDANIIVADFLLENVASKMAPLRRGGFGFVIGNPPYVSTTRLAASQKPVLRTLFSTAVGRVDLYTLFFERALPMLSASGVLAFITPDKFLASETSRSLRQFLLRHAHVRSIARFDSHKVFPDAAVVPCITVLDRIQRPEIEVISCHSERGRSVAVLSESRASSQTLGAGPWQFRSAELLEVVERVRAGCPTLANLASRISAGPATGRDELYVRPRGELDVEPQLIKRALRGRDIGAFGVTDPYLDILLPFDFSRPEPRLVSLSRFPRAKRYLERHRHDLENRHCVRVWEKAWYDLHDSPTHDLAGQTKIVVPDIAESCRFAVDRGAYFPLHSAYYVLLHDNDLVEYVTAILNSRVVEFMVRLLAPVAKDGFSRFRRQFLATIPVPVPRAATRKAIVRTSRSADALNDAVSHLFQVAPADRRLIDGYLTSRSRGTAP